MRLHTKFFDAQIELANKKDQRQWTIDQTSNDWFFVRKLTKAERLENDNRFATADTINHRYTQRCQMIEEHGRLTSEQETP
jgi:hypothetical protein